MLRSGRYRRGSAQGATLGHTAAEGDRATPRRSTIGFGPLRLLRSSLELEARHVEGPIADLGCGSRPYARIFSARYIGFDLRSAHGSPDVVCAAEHMPVRARAMRTVLSTQQLEHVSNPDQVLGEAWRILRLDGLLLLSTHGVWAHHPDPSDYWRWTEEGLLRLLREHGFAPVRVYHLGGSVLAAVLLAVYPLGGLARSDRRASSLVGRAALVLINSIVIPIDRAVERMLPRHYASVGYLVAARKVCESPVGGNDHD